MIPQNNKNYANQKNYNQLFIKFCETISDSNKKDDELNIEKYYDPEMDMIISDYDRNCDGFPEYREAYRIKKITSEGEIKRVKKPLFYFIDYNMNKVFDLDEIMIDELEDGFNGNEHFLLDDIFPNLKKEKLYKKKERKFEI